MKEIIIVELSRRRIYTEKIGYGKFEARFGVVSSRLLAPRSIYLH
jgi:hypothetical protein